MASSFNQRDERGNIIYPYLPEGRVYLYAPESNPFMKEALDEVAKMEVECPEVNRPTAATLVKEGQVVAKGRNGSIHSTFCPRVALASLSGQDYDYCPNHCHSKNHAEATTINKAKEKRVDTRGTDLYLAGHWWACQPCWDAMITAGVDQIFLVKAAHDRYDEGKRRQPGKVAGTLTKPISALVLGNEADQFSSWLGRANFTFAPSAAKAEIVILLPGASTPTLVDKPIYNYQSYSDLKQALAQLSQDLKDFI